MPSKQIPVYNYDNKYGTKLAASKVHGLEKHRRGSGKLISTPTFGSGLHCRAVHIKNGKKVITYH